jgi:hypothetical protein
MRLISWTLQSGSEHVEWQKSSNIFPVCIFHEYAEWSSASLPKTWNETVLTQWILKIKTCVFTKCAKLPGIWISRKLHNQKRNISSGFKSGAQMGWSVKPSLNTKISRKCNGTFMMNNNYHKVLTWPGRLETKRWICTILQTWQDPVVYDCCLYSQYCNVWWAHICRLSGSFHEGSSPSYPQDVFQG